MSNRRPRPEKSAPVVAESAAEATAEGAAEPTAATKAPIHVSKRLAIPLPNRVPKKGRPSVFNLDALEVGECFLFAPENLTAIRRAAAGANQKWSKKTGEKRVFRGQEIDKKESIRKYQVMIVSGSDLEAIPEDELRAVFPDAAEKPTEVGGCWRTL